MWPCDSCAPPMGSEYSPEKRAVDEGYASYRMHLNRSSHVL